MMGRVAVAVMSLILTLVLLEAILRLTVTDPRRVDPAVRYDPEIGWVQEPNARGVLRDLHGELHSIYQTNSLGFHDVDHETSPRPGVRRILFLGDSFMDATQVPLEKTLVKQIERKINESGGQWECINMGVSGYNTAQAVAVYRKVGRGFRPNIVVLGFCLDNDPADNLPELAFDKIRPYLLPDTSGRLEFHPMDVSAMPSHASPRKERSAWVAWLYRTYLWTYKRSAMVQVRAWLRERRGLRRRPLPVSWQIFLKEPPAEFRKFWDSAYEVSIRSLDHLNQTVQSDGGKFLVFLIPSRLQVYEDWRGEAENLYLNFEPDRLDRDRPNRMLMKSLAEWNVPALDLLPAFDAASSPPSPRLYYRRDGHLTPAGHDAAAREILTSILTRGWRE